MKCSRSTVRKGAWILLAGSTLASGGVAFAQEAKSSDEVSVGDIIVTAQKREERLRDVPVSVSALTGNDIENRGATSLDALQASVPALRLVDIGPGSQRIQLRGISQYQGLPTVGNYIDEFSLNGYAASGTAEIRLLDVQRVEVLRGPQPALYGEGSMGGTIRYVTVDPDLSNFSGNGLAEISTPRGGEVGWRVEGVVNLPLSVDKAGLRLAAAREEAGGWIDGAPGKNLNDRDTTTVRGKLLLKPSDVFTVSIMGLYNKASQDFKSYSGADRKTGQIVPSPATQEYKLGTLNLSYDAGPVTLLSATGYLDQDGRSVDDSAQFYNRLFGGPFLRTALTDSVGTLKKFSQEFRLSSNGTGPLRYLLGVSYTDGKDHGVIDGDGESLIPGLPASALGVVFHQDAKTRSKIWAVFGSVAYEIADQVTIDLGGRYFRDKRSIDSIFTITGFPIPPTIALDSATFDSFNPRVALTVKTGASGIIYANAAKGFRSGGFNSVTAAVVPATFDPEHLWSYEVGTKQSFLGGHLFVEASIYYNEYKNIQSNTVVPGTGFAAVLNSGKASGPGVDLAIRAMPSKDLTFSASLGYNKLRFDTNATDKAKGDPLDLVPDWNWSAAIDYTPELTDSVGLAAHADIGFTDAGTITLRQLPEVKSSQARAVANLRLGFTFSTFEAYVFANNVLDENKIVNPAFGAFFEPIYTKPRAIGLGVKGHF